MRNFYHHFEIRENNHEHSTATSVHSNKLRVTTKYFWGKNICDAKTNFWIELDINKILAYMQIASAKSQSVREYLTNRLSWVAARVPIVSRVCPAWST